METSENRVLTPGIPFLGALAFAVGTAIGWGSLVVTSKTYLAQAGPAGSVAGLVIGALVMLVIARNYSYLMQIYPDSGGVFTYTTKIFGYDHGFLAAWFLILTYIAILWANASSIPLFTRYFLGGALEIGKLYTLFGYDVYLLESVVTILVIILVGFLLVRSKKASIYAMIGLMFVFTAGIVIVSLAALFSNKGGLAPSFTPDASVIKQIFNIAVISPWAFIGFESISHETEEFSFKKTGIFKLFVIALSITTALYILVILLSVTAYPERYGSWLEYIRDIGNLSGIEALPPFYAAGYYLGDMGIWILMASLMALVITSLIGNATALSRLFYSMAKADLLPRRFAVINKNGTPGNAIWLIAVLSVAILFVGRTAIGWIVDVTTICAVLIYGYVSVAARSIAINREDKIEKITGALGFILMVLFGMYMLLPNLVTTGSMDRETYFLFIVWSILGFLYFRYIIGHDKKKRYGDSLIVWTVFLVLVLLVSLIWMRQSMFESNNTMLMNVREYYLSQGDAASKMDEEFIENQMQMLQNANTRTSIMAIGMFAFALIMMFTNYAFMKKRSEENERILTIDPMTHVKSKHAFILEENKYNELIPAGEAGEFAVVVCDVNGLKHVNDTLGHKAGDEYIISASRMVGDIFQHSPVYRIGGDEFVVIMTGRDFTMRKELMKLLHDRSIEHINSNEVVVSGGISDYEKGSDPSFNTVFERADNLMYEEKQLLKGFGSITRDEQPEEEEKKNNSETPDILNVRKKILIVDDEEINRLILGNTLEKDYDIIYAADGVEALEKVKEVPELDLMMLDVMMPRMNGREVLKIMKSDADMSGIPVLVFTADQESEIECLHFGAADFIPKPYPDPEIIKARVSRVLEFTQNREIVKSTERDSLTKLYNIDYFNKFVTMYDTHYPDMAMDAVVFNLNQFRMVNERYGREYADNILRRLGEQIKKTAREVGGVGSRQGIDTFLLYCPHREDYKDILDKITDALSEGEGSADGQVSLRVGVYPEVDKSLDIDRRFDRAKMAADLVRSGHAVPIGIYNAKMQESAMYRDRLLRDFRSSLKQGCFTVYYQPKFDIRHDKPILASAEALVRWNHPELGMIGPKVFIPMLEESGMILELDKYVWTEVARQIRSWKDKVGFSVPISVNMSRVDMMTPDLKSVFRSILDEYKLTTDDIILEVTESAYTSESEQIIDTAKELGGMEMGFRIEMDDFGTGYSSLGILSKLPVDALKLDMSFIKNAFGENRDVKMIELVIDIADYLHVPVIAEGVETEEEVLVLKALGCDLIQGYFFSRPVPPEEFNRFLETRKNEAVPEDFGVKNRLSISKALTYDYESIYYVDTETGCYMEFYSGPQGELKIRPRGTDFFEDIQKELVESVSPDARVSVRDALTKDKLLEVSNAGVYISYGKPSDTGDAQYSLDVIQPSTGLDHHLVMGEKRV